MTREEELLRASIEGLYAAFGRYPLADVVEGCPCCTTEADQERIRSKPLRELTVEALDRFASKALSTWGTKDDFKHFLPRLFELHALEGDPFTLPAALVGKLTYAQPPWRQWPADEQQALDAYFQALWRYVLANPSYTRADYWLELLAQAHDDLDPFLTVWWEMGDNDSAIAQLAYFLYWREAELQKGALSSPYWEDCRRQMQQAMAWTSHPRTVQMLRAGLPRVKNHPWLVERDFCTDWIDWYLNPPT